MRIIGLTGNSGSGKSQVSQILHNLGAYIIDADKIAREILDSSAYDEVVGFLGTKILNEDGSINRKRCAEIIFNNPDARKKHMAITHKYIIAEMMKQLQQAKEKDYNFAVMDAPLLIEADLHLISDSVWVVKAEKDICIKRIMERDKITYEMAEKRLNSQMPFDTMEKYADIVIENSRDMNYLEYRVMRELKKCL